MKKLAVRLMVLILVICITGCAPKSTTTPATDNSGSPPAPADDPVRIEVIGKGFQHDFWKNVCLGSEKAAAEFGVELNFVGPEGESAIADQVDMLTNAINKKPSAICLAVLDTNAAMDAINRAMTAGIPMIGFDSGVPDAPAGSILGNASTDNYKAGELAAKKMFPAVQNRIAAAGTTVRIGVVSQEATSQSITQRTEGFVDQMVSLVEALPEYGTGKVAVVGHDKFANEVDAATAKTVIEVRIPAAVDDAAGKTEAQALLEKPDLIGIYCSNEFGAKAVINANEALSGSRLGVTEDKIIAVGFDSGALQIAAVKNRVFYGSVTQDPVSIGYNAVKMAVMAAKGEAVSDVDTGAQWYDSTNIEDSAIAPLLYQ